MTATLRTRNQSGTFSTVQLLSWCCVSFNTNMSIQRTKLEAAFSKTHKILGIFWMTNFMFRNDTTVFSISFNQSIHHSSLFVVHVCACLCMCARRTMCWMTLVSTLNNISPRWQCQQVWCLTQRHYWRKYQSTSTRVTNFLIVGLCMLLLCCEAPPSNLSLFIDQHRFNIDKVT